MTQDLDESRWTPEDWGRAHLFTKKKGGSVFGCSSAPKGSVMLTLLDRRALLGKQPARYGACEASGGGREVPDGDRGVVERARVEEDGRADPRGQFRKCAEIPMNRKSILEVQTIYKELKKNTLKTLRALGTNEEMRTIPRMPETLTFISLLV